MSAAYTDPVRRVCNEKLGRTIGDGVPKTLVHQAEILKFANIVLRGSTIDTFAKKTQVRCNHFDFNSAHLCWIYALGIKTLVLFYLRIDIRRIDYVQLCARHKIPDTFHFYRLSKIINSNHCLILRSSYNILLMKSTSLVRETKSGRHVFVRKRVCSLRPGASLLTNRSSHQSYVLDLWCTRGITRCNRIAIQI